MANYREEIIKLLDKQDIKGLCKYGTWLEDSPDDIHKRLDHLAEELVDALRYIFWIKEKLHDQK